MLTLDKMKENLEKEVASIEYDADCKEICNNYSEENLFFYETGNRMGGEYGIFFFKKNGINRIVSLNETNEWLIKHFPIAMSLEYKSDVDYKNEKYKYFFTGFGGKLYIDKRIYDDFYKKIKMLADKCKISFSEDNYHEVFIHTYWITIAKDILK